jgi:hypothetical protein
MDEAAYWRLSKQETELTTVGRGPRLADRFLLSSSATSVAFLDLEVSHVLCLTHLVHLHCPPRILDVH